MGGEFHPSLEAFSTSQPEEERLRKSGPENASQPEEEPGPYYVSLCSIEKHFQVQIFDQILQ